MNDSQTDGDDHIDTDDTDAIVNIMPATEAKLMAVRSCSPTRVSRGRRLYLLRDRLRAA